MAGLSCSQKKAASKMKAAFVHLVILD